MYRLDSPLDRETRHPGLLGQDIALHALDDGLRGRVVVQLGGVVFVVDVVPDADELAPVVGAGEEDDGDADDVRVGDALRVGGVGLEWELAHSDGDGAHEEGV